MADESDAVELKFGLTLQQIMDVVSELFFRQPNNVWIWGILCVKFPVLAEIDGNFERK